VEGDRNRGLSYGGLASSFLSRGLKLASDAGSRSLHAAAKRQPHPSNRNAIPRTAIATLVLTHWHAAGARFSFSIHPSNN